MTALSDHATLIALCDPYCAATKRSEVRVAELATGNPHFFRRLRKGKSCTVRTYLRAYRWFLEHWPAGLPWPDDIPRPDAQTVVNREVV